MFKQLTGVLDVGFRCGVEEVEGASASSLGGTDDSSLGQACAIREALVLSMGPQVPTLSSGSKTLRKSDRTRSAALAMAIGIGTMEGGGSLGGANGISLGRTVGSSLV